MNVHLLATSVLAAVAATDAFTFVGRANGLNGYKDRKSCGRSLFASSSTNMVEARANLLRVSEELKKEEGVFVMSSDAKSKLKDAVAELESTSSPPSQNDYEDYFSGDWTLLCTTATSESKLPFQSVSLPNLTFLNSGPLADIKESIQGRFVVQQRIRSKDRIDHVLQYSPPDTLGDLFPDETDLPEALLSLNVNPLQVKESKVTLVHKAEILSLMPVLRTKLGLQSIVLSVAGESQILDPSGADVLGLNLPLGEFLNSGTFDTTYMDSELRVSRGKVGVVEQLRIFTKSSTGKEDEEFDEIDEVMEEDVMEEIVEDVTEDIAEEVISEIDKVDPVVADELRDIADESDSTEDAVKDASGDVPDAMTETKDENDLSGGEDDESFKESREEEATEDTKESEEDDETPSD